MFWNENFEPVSSGHLDNINPESEGPYKRKTISPKQIIHRLLWLRRHIHLYQKLQQTKIGLFHYDVQNICTGKICFQRLDTFPTQFKLLLGSRFRKSGFIAGSRLVQQRCYQGHETEESWVGDYPTALTKLHQILKN